MIVYSLVNDGDLRSSDGVDPIISRGLMLVDGFPRDFGESQKVATGDLIILPLSLGGGVQKQIEVESVVVVVVERKG